MDKDEIYCSICNACGEEGCCSPLKCRFNGGLYCEYYINVLKASYLTLNHICNILSEDMLDKSVDFYMAKLEELSNEKIQD